MKSIIGTKGQSLYEVVIALGIISLILVTSISLSTSSVRNTSFARNDSLATKYAQEGTEYLRQQRDSSWDSFAGQANGVKKSLGNLSWPPTGSCNIPQATHFCRSITLTRAGTDTINALIEVSWDDGQGTHGVRSATTYTRWR